MNEEFTKPMVPTSSSPLRIGLLVDSLIVSHYIYDFVEWAARNPRIAVTHLIVHSPIDARTEVGSKPGLVQRARRLFRAVVRHGMYSVMSEVLVRCVVAFERRLIARSKRHAVFLREYDLSTCVKEILHVVPTVSKSGFVYRFQAADIEKIRALDLDILVRCGGRILRGDILKAAKLGVLSFHHADNRINRGGPAAFWEVYHRHATTGFTLQRLTDDLDAGDVLMRGHFGTRHYYLLNKAFLFEKSNYYLKLLVDKIALTGRLPDFLPKYPYSHKLFKSPLALELTLYFARFCYDVCRKRLMKLFGFAARWNVAYVRKNWRNAEYWRGVKLKNLAFRYLADPFVISRSERSYCFMEELDSRTGRGSIVVYELTQERGIRIGTALEEGFHLSFPYLFEYDNQLYMCPECSESRSIRIYKCIEFPLRWKLDTIAMEGVSAADTMIFEKDGKWWLFTNIDPVGVGDFCSELFIFSAASPLANNWTPHPQNPVVVDAGYARNAGLLRDGAKYFRCSQQQAFDVYGKRLQINEMVELTETSFAERCVSVATPSFGADIIGAHHLHGAGDITVFDFLTISRTATGAET